MTAVATLAATPVSEAAVRERDLAAERYVALARRAAELTASAALSRPELRVASPAVPPEGRDWVRLAAWPLAGLIAGLLLGLAWALAPASAPESPPPAAPEPTPASAAGRPR